MTTEPLLSVEDVGKYLRVARHSVYRSVDGRGLPAHKIRQLRALKLTEVADRLRATAAGAHDEPRTGGDR